MSIIDTFFLYNTNFLAYLIFFILMAVLSSVLLLLAALLFLKVPTKSSEDWLCCLFSLLLIDLFWHQSQNLLQIYLIDYPLIYKILSDLALEFYIYLHYSGFHHHTVQIQFEVCLLKPTRFWSKSGSL